MNMKSPFQDKKIRCRERLMRDTSSCRYMLRSMQPKEGKGGYRKRVN